MRLPPWLLGLLLLSPAVLVGAAIWLSPEPAGPWTYPLAQRLLYVHVPLAWVAYVGFAIAVVAAVLVLRASAAGRDAAGTARILRASHEVTTVFAAGALLTGFAWGYEFALWDPLSDPKVLSTMVLVAVLAGLWALSSSAAGPRGERLVASLTLVGFAAVPASYLASRLASQHPDLTQGTDISGTMLGLLALATVGFQLLFLGLLWVRADELALEARLDRSARHLEDPGGGTAW